MLEVCRKWQVPEVWWQRTGLNPLAILHFLPAFNDFDLFP